jgi:hypothetical protein
MPSKTHLFTVEGRGQFPLDMLRYDSCWPESQADVTELGATHDRFAEKRARVVTLRGLSEPTEGRWQSFGWIVI